MEKGVWRTIRGRRVFIREGESLDEAMERSGKFNSLTDDERKEKQLEIIKKENPAEDEVHTWIRKKEDINTFEEALKQDDWEGWEKSGFDPDYTAQMAKEALKNNEIVVYSSYNIKQGTFVTPSKMEAESYSGSGKVFSKKVKLTDVAWVDPTQGQYANVEEYFKK